MWSAYPFIVILAFHLLSNVPYSIHGVLHVNVVLQGHPLPELGVLWQVSDLPAIAFGRLLIHKEGRGGICHSQRTSTLPPTQLVVRKRSLLVFFPELLTDVWASGSPHEEERGKPLQEDPFHPRGHGVCAGGSMMNIEHADAGDDGECDQHHCKHEILSNQRHS